MAGPRQSALYCPLTQDLYVEPVLYLAPNDGAAQIYERAALQTFLQSAKLFDEGGSDDDFDGGTAMGDATRDMMWGGF